jgi:four helix bundle protein
MDKSLENLEIYQMAVSLSKTSREVFVTFDYMTKKAIWLQYIRSMDSIGANIAEWYWRFHYLDSAKFYYNSRWSLFETKHRLKLMYDRKLISEDTYKNVRSNLNILWKKLNNFISALKERAK